MDISQDYPRQTESFKRERPIEDCIRIWPLLTTLGESIN